MAIRPSKYGVSQSFIAKVRALESYDGGRVLQESFIYERIKLIRLEKKARAQLEYEKKRIEEFMLNMAPPAQLAEKPILPVRKIIFVEEE